MASTEIETTNLEVYNVHKAAKAYGVTPTSIRAAEARGLPNIQIGRETYYPKAACDRWAAAVGFKKFASVEEHQKKGIQVISQDEFDKNSMHYCTGYEAASMLGVDYGVVYRDRRRKNTLGSVTIDRGTRVGKATWPIANVLDPDRRDRFYRAMRCTLETVKNGEMLLESLRPQTKKATQQELPTPAPAPQPAPTTKTVAIGLILSELERAEELHPEWPNDRIHGAAILAEEAGELVRACLNRRYHGGSMEDIMKEAIQTGAMAVRFIINLTRQTES